MAASASSSSEGPPILEQMKSVAAGVTREVTKYMADQYYRDELYHQYLTLEDFSRCNDDAKRVVVIGCTGAGKSTLLNVMGGFKYVQNQTTDDMEYEWTAPDNTVLERDEAARAAVAKQLAVKMAAAKPDEDVSDVALLFESKGGTASVTNKTSFAQMKWFGAADRQFIAVDTPGHDDSAGYDIESKEARDALGELAADLHNKLKAMGHIHTLLVLHNDPTSNRLNHASYTILKMIDEKFAETQEQVWKHVIVAYSKCNPHDSSWRAGMAKKKKALLAKMHEEFPKSKGIDIPILALGGGILGNPDGSAVETSLSEGDFEELWNLIDSATVLDTTKIEPFKGIDSKYQEMIEAKESAEARAKAALIWFTVVFKVGIVCCALFFRAFMLPGWMGMMLLNFSGGLDELVIVGFVIWLIGTHDVLYSLKHVYDLWIKPRIGPVHDQVKGLYQRYTGGKAAAPSPSPGVKAAQGKKD